LGRVVFDAIMALIFLSVTYLLSKLVKKVH